MEPRVLLYEEKGSGDPVVLVPGGLTGWVSWIPHQERLAAGYRAVRVQPIHNELGSAGAAGDPDYTVEIERDSLLMTLDALGIEDAHLAGWSGGGRALIEFAIEYPSRVRTLTLVEPAAYWLLELLGEGDPDVERVNSFVLPLAGNDVSEDGLAEFLELAGFVKSKDEARAHPNWERWLPHRNALSWQATLDLSHRSLEDLKAITAPVLVAHGNATAGWLKRVAGVVAAQVQGATSLELQGEHPCHIQDMDTFMVAFETHLQRA